jgi:hypothetical protein
MQANVLPCKAVSNGCCTKLPTKHIIFYKQINQLSVTFYNLYGHPYHNSVIQAMYARVNCACFGSFDSIQTP